MNEDESLERALDCALKIDDPAEQRAYLAKVSDGDKVFLAEMESLLAAHYGAADDFMKTRIDQLLGEVSVEEEGDEIGSYQLIEQIGEGGFGTVYRAEQRHPVKREVALKVIKAGMDCKEVVARFEAERQALALMDHPNIAKVFDAGTTGGGRPFFVMELVKGSPLTHYCLRNSLGVKERIQLFMSVCSAVQHAHQKGIIHRDLKPSNILVSEHDGKSVVKVIDFGIAKAIGMELTEKTIFTQLGRMIGTPQYMSPEQADLKALDIDTRSDIYSLGVVLYELLTGTTPLAEKELSKAAYDTIQKMIREETPPKPSARVTESKKRGESKSTVSRDTLQKDLDWVVMRALEKDRERRYETVGALAKDLERYLGNEPVSAGPPSAIYRLGKFAKRNRRALASCAVAVSALLVGLSVAGGLWLRENQRVTRVEESVDTLLVEASELMDGGEVTGDFQDNRPFNRASNLVRRASELLENTGRRNPELEKRSGELLQRVEAEERARAFVFAIEEVEVKSISVSRIFNQSPTSKIERIEGAFRRFGLDLPGESTAEAVEAVSQLKGELKDFALVGLQSWVNALVESNPERAAQLQEVIEIADNDPWRRELRAAIRTKDAIALEFLADSPDLDKQPPQVVLGIASAFAEHQLAAPMMEIMRRTQAQHPTRFWPNFRLGMALASAVDREEGSDLRHEVIQTASTNFAGVDQGRSEEAVTINPQLYEAIGFLRVAVAVRPDLPLTRLILGASLSGAGHPEEALATLRKGASLNPDSILFDATIGWVLVSMGQPEKALPYLKRAAAGDDSGFIDFYGLGMSFVGLGRYDEGRTVLMKAVKLNDENPEMFSENVASIGIMGVPSQFDEAFVSLTIAFMQALHGHYDEALLACREYLKDGQEDTRALYVKGFCLLRMSELRAAGESLEKGIEQGPKTREVLKLLGLIYMRQKHLIKARSCLEQALAMDPEAEEEAEILANLGACLIEQGLSKEAGGYLEKAVELDPANPLVWHNLGSYFLKKNESAKAIELMEKAVGIDPNYSISNRILASLYWEADDFEKSIAAAERLNEAETFQQLGISFMEEQMLDQAIELFKKAIALKPGLRDAQFGLGSACFKTKRFAEAIIPLQKSIELMPDSQEAHRILAHALRKQGRYEQALISLVESLQLGESKSLTEGNLMFFLNASGRSLLADLVHGDCGDHACPVRVAAEAERKLEALLKEKLKVTPIFLRTLKQASSDLLPALMGNDTISAPGIEDLKLIWKDERAKVLERLGSVTLRQIFLTRSQESPDRKRALADDLLKQLKAGADFVELGNQYSEYKASLEPAEVEYGDLAPAIIDAAFSLKPGQVFPEVIEIPNGYFLLKVESRSPGEADQFEDEGVERAARLVYVSRESEKWEQRVLKRLTNPEPDLIEAKVRNLLGESLLAQGERDRARQLFEEALKAFEFETFTNDPIKSRVLENLKQFAHEPGMTVNRIADEGQAILNPDEAKSIEEALKKVNELRAGDRPEGDKKLLVALLELGISRRNAGQYDEAILVFEDASEKSAKHYSEENEAVTICLLHRGLALRLRGSYEAAVEQFEAILEMTKAKGTLLADIHEELGVSLGKLGELKREETHLRKSLELKLGIWGENHPKLTQTKTNLGWNLLNRGDYAEARKMLEQSIEVERTPETLHVLGVVLGKFAEFEEAGKLLREATEALELRNEHLDRIKVAYVWNDLAGTFRKRGLRDDAVKYYRKALKRHEEVMGPGHRGEVWIRTSLGLELKGRDAVEMQKKALEIILKDLGPNRDHHELVACLNNLALAHGAIGELQDAERRSKESLAMARRVYPKGKPHQFLALPLLVLAQTQRDLQQFPEACKNSRAGVEMLRKVFPEGHPEIIVAIRIEALILAESGRHADAVPLLREVLKNGAPGDRDFAKDQTALGSCLVATRDFGAAEIELRKAVGFFRQEPDREAGLLALAYTELAFTMRKLGKLVEAEKFARKGIEIYRKQEKKGEGLASALQNLSAILGASDKPGEALEAAREAQLICIEYLGNSPETVGYAHKIVAAALADLERHAEAVTELTKALDLIKRPGRRMSIFTDMSSSFLKLGKKDAATKALADIEELAKGLVAPGDLSVIGILKDLGFSHSKAGNWQTAEALLRAAIRLERAEEPQPNLVVIQISLGRLLLPQQKYEEAQRVYQEAIQDLKKNAEAKPDLSFVSAHFGLGEAFLGLGQYAAAEQEVVEAARVLEGLEGRNHPSMVAFDFMLAVIKYESGDYQLALAGFREVLGRLKPGDLQRKMRLKNGVAECLRSIGKIKEAKAEIEEAIAIQKEIKADAPGGSQKVLAMILRDENEFEAADMIFRELMTKLDEELQEGDLERATIRVEFATSLARQKQFKEALVLAEVALRVQRETLRNGHPDFKETLELLAGIHAGLGDDEKAATFTAEAQKLK